MLVVLAPDKFKGSLSARQVAAALAAGLRESGAPCREVPVADGGDGTVAAFVASGWEAVPVAASGPTGMPVSTGYARRGGAAVIELAAICGLGLLPGGTPDPLGAGTFGLGEVVRHAIGAGAGQLVLGLGGSASTDGGAGMLSALGARILDADGAPLPPGGAALARAARIAFAAPLLPAGVDVVLACDVDNPLLGPVGAAAVYGPQKGADPGDVATLEAALCNWERVVRAAGGRDTSARPGAGAAGGVGFAAMALLDARMRPGVEVVLEEIGFADLLAGADLVVTGEGRLDAQSLHGKAPLGVVAAARAAGVPVLAVAGRCDLAPDQLAAAGVAACFPLADLEPDPARSMADAAALLRTIARTRIAPFLRRGL